eukprot:TRINITY_DN26502_c0_g1_i1.p1 TRINITY_DN26502_c0_g1~~TRINITY_DN26502_c0_g1_i1.p1  ORF type:complete len:168 (+),score=46.96 TRINITY_DN26502_c0_g1_i1:33-536(+)
MESLRGGHGLGLLVLGVLLFQIIRGSSAIQCWECNSKTDPGCLDPFNGYSLGSVNCSQADADVEHLREDDGTLLEPTLCRKTVQVVEEEIRVIRGCGWIPNTGVIKGRDCFSRVGTMEVSVRHCVCDTDGCNGSGNLRPGLASLLPALITLPSAFLVFKKNSRRFLS